MRDRGGRLERNESVFLQLCIRRQKEPNGMKTKVFVRVVTPSSAPELARRCPFPAVTHPTRRGLARHIRVNSDGTTLLCVRLRNRTPAVVLLELANCTIRIRVDPHGRQRADFNICPPVTASLTTLVTASPPSSRAFMTTLSTTWTSGHCLPTTTADDSAHALPFRVNSRRI